MFNDIETLFLCFFDMQVSSFIKYLFNYFSYFKIFTYITQRFQAHSYIWLFIRNTHRTQKQQYSWLYFFSDPQWKKIHQVVWRNPSTDFQHFLRQEGSQRNASPPPVKCSNICAVFWPRKPCLRLKSPESQDVPRYLGLVI